MGRPVQQLSETMHFTVHGEGLTRICRGFVASDDWQRAWRVLREDLIRDGVGLSEEQATGVVQGRLKLVNDSENKDVLRLVDDDERNAEAQSFAGTYARVYAGRYEHEGAWYKVVAKPDEDEEGAPFRFGDELLANKHGAIVKMAQECAFIVRVAKRPPPFWVRNRTPQEAEAEFVRVHGESLDVRISEYDAAKRERDAGESSNEDVERDQRVHELALASQLNLMGRGDAAKRILDVGLEGILREDEEDVSAKQEAAWRKAVKQQADDGAGWTTLRVGKKRVRVPSGALEQWALHGTKAIGTAAPWQMVSRAGVKWGGIADSGIHTDLYVGAGGKLSAYKAEHPIQRALERARDRLQRERAEYEVTVLHAGETVAAPAWHPKSASARPKRDVVAILPDASVTWGPLVGNKHVKAFIVEVGGAFAHVVKVHQETRARVSVVRLAGARTAFKAGSVVRVDAEHGTVKVVE